MLAAATLAILACSSGTVCAQGGFAPPELATTQVRDNIYMIRSGSSGNVTVIVGDDSVLLIDDNQKIVRKIIEQGIRCRTCRPECQMA